MATEVVHAHQPDGQLFHQPGPRTSSPSSSSLFLDRRESGSESPRVSSLNSSPRQSTIDFSNTSSFRSIPISSGLSLEDQFGEEEEGDDIDFPNYGSLQAAPQEAEKDLQPLQIEDVESDAPDISTTTDTTISDSPIQTPSVVDDSAIKQEPSRHVDYLSHDWLEEDIWSSWRHIVSQRKVYGPRSRLENASWRTWAQSKYRLQTVPPERLNWLKESDVTWLYGPLKSALTHPITSNTSHSDSTSISKNTSFVKKPILKKRSVSEVMLQKSISTSSLVKQAAASVQAQQTKHTRASMARTRSDYTLPHSNPPSRDELDYFSSRTSSCTGTPSDGPVKHIRFDEKVEQCIAVNCKSGFDDESELDGDSYARDSALSDSSSDEGLCMMRGKRNPQRVPKETSQKARLSVNNSFSSQMIETLPSTTLKYRTDSPEVDEANQQHHVFGKGWGRPKLSPSPSQETLRPSRPSRNFLLGDDDEEDDADNSNTWSFGANNPKSSLGASASAEPSSSRASYEGIEGMRRTESGMFMPYDEDEDDMVATGLFGRVSETFNTFKDIGYVLYNVGWRK